MVCKYNLLYIIILYIILLCVLLYPMFLLLKTENVENGVKSVFGEKATASTNLFRRRMEVKFVWNVYFFIGLRITEYVCSTTESTMRQMPTQNEKPTSCSSPKSTAAMAMLYSGSRL